MTRFTQKFSTKKKWRKTISALKRRGRFQFGSVTTFWYDDDLSDLRFRIHPEIYDTVKKIWEPEMVPFVTEALYCMGSTCYRNQLPNLLKLLVVDESLELPHWTQSTNIAQFELLPMLLNMDRTIIDFINGIHWADFDHRRRIAYKLHGYQEISAIYYKPGKNDPWRTYYEMIVKPIMQSIAISGARSKLIPCLDWRRVADNLHLPSDLDEETVQYLIEDAFDYIDAADCFQYNPLWIFGSECYEEIIKDIWSWDWTELARRHHEKTAPCDPAGLCHHDSLSS